MYNLGETPTSDRSFCAAVPVFSGAKQSAAGLFKPPAGLQARQPDRSSRRSPPRSLPRCKMDPDFERKPAGNYKARGGQQAAPSERLGQDRGLPVLALALPASPIAPPAFSAERYRRCAACLHRRPHRRSDHPRRPLAQRRRRPSLLLNSLQIGYAPTGRATCQGCKELIEK